MTGPRYTDLVEGLPSTVPFVGPETQERQRGAPFEARLGANENVFGPSPRAIAAMKRAVAGTWMYGDPENFDLKAALSAHLDVTPENIIVGEGIDGLLGYLCRMLLEEDDAVVTSDGAYPTFNFHVSGYGGELHKVPYQRDRENPVALIEKADKVGAKMIYLANPDNPMGTFHAGSVIEMMVEALPEGCLLVLDEAYIEFAPEGTAPKIDPNDPRVIRFRTFSKAYGMAGARVGYGIGAPDLIRSFNKIRNHFGMSRISQAGALEALADQRYLADTLVNVSEARERIRDIASDNGLKVVKSGANFVAIDCGAGGAFAGLVLNALLAQGIFVRMPFVAPQDRCIRISAGTPEDLDRFERALPTALAEARAEFKD